MYSLLVTIARVLFDGQVFGMNYLVFQPDGYCYSRMAYNFAGYSSQTSALDIATKYPGASFAETDCSSTGARVLYPLISSIFVRAMGMNGMLVVPILSFFAFFIFLYILLRTFKVSEMVSLCIIATLISSSTIQRWFVSNLVDSLFYLLSLIAIWQTAQFFSYFSKLYIFWLILPISLLALTRRSFHVFWILGIICLFHILRNRNDFKNVPIIITFFFIIPLAVDIGVRSQLGTQNGLWTINALTAAALGENRVFDPGNVATTISIDSTDNLFDRLYTVSKSIFEIAVTYLFTSFGQLVVVDRIFFLFLVFWFISIPFLWRNVSNFAATAAILGPLLLLAIASLQGTLGANFRFELAMLPLVALGVGLKVQYALDNSIRNPFMN